jgi:hypothetical protein
MPRRVTNIFTVCSQQQWALWTSDCFVIAVLRTRLNGSLNVSPAAGLSVLISGTNWYYHNPHMRVHPVKV